MTTAFLALNVRDSSPPQVKSYVNASPTAVGTSLAAAGGLLDVDTSVGGASADSYQVNCPVRQFGGLGTFLAKTGGAIYRSTNSGATWTSVRTLTNLGATIQSANSGLHVLYTSGVPKIVIAYNSAFLGTGLYFDVSSDGTTWSTFGPFTAPSGLFPMSFMTPLAWHNKLYILFTNSAATAVFAGVVDLGSNTMTFVNNAIASGVNEAAVVFNDRYFVVGGTTTMNLWEISGASWILVGAAFDAGVTGITVFQNKRGAFVDGTTGKMYTLHWKSAASGWRCYEWTSGLVATDITATVIPAAMSGASAPTETSRVFVLVDAPANPGGAPSIVVYYATSGGTATALSAFQWNGPASVMTLLDSGGVAANGMPFVPEAQGSTYWASTQTYSIEQVATTPVSGGVRFSFKLYGASAAGALSVRAFRGAATAGYPQTLATISTPSVGVIAANVNTGLTADGGATTYQFTWNAVTDGFVNGQFPKLVLEVF